MAIHNSTDYLRNVNWASHKTDCGIMASAYGAHTVCSRHYFQGRTQMSFSSWEVGPHIISILQLRKQAQWYLLTCSRSHNSWLVEPGVKTQVVWAQNILCGMICGGPKVQKRAKANKLFLMIQTHVAKWKIKASEGWTQNSGQLLPVGSEGLWSWRSGWKLQQQWSFLKTE